MLTFFATLLVNVLIGTIFYLVISLKIEKSASELHVKKIRKEMDDMIREFNSTADRNISLLENRISVMNRLLEKAGAAGIDLTLDDRTSSLKETQTELSVRPSSVEPVSAKEYPAGFAGFLSHSSEFIRSIGTGIKLAIHEVNTIKETEKSQKNISSSGTKAPTIDIRIGEGVETVKSGKDSSSVYSGKGTLRSPIVRDESEIVEMFSRFATRKQAYELASQLAGEGYSVDQISHLSGIPAGEISLVVNLGGR